ncbi:EF-Tu/IF-2/RF-3 family GTPase [Acidiplasma sp.]|jgi:selenocysteine-specific translation elongation factor|nr:EF-Tu/IF-2/RF-3 family GTPase [Acidiplasma sp.]WMT55717.1 MAG: EF-Tu/IF-2/RF-3 family GTPase [Acidiplasma sp.]
MVMPMESLNIFTYNAQEYIREIAKAGTNSDITLYHRKDGDRIFTFIEPSKYPDKLSSLTDSIFPADIAVISGKNLDKHFGEVIVALDLMGKKNGFIISDEDKKDIIKKIISNTNLRNYNIFTGRPMELVDQLSDVIPERKLNGNYTLIDHFFKVRGVGTVALGFVLSGEIKKHDKLIISDIDKEIEIKSIQMNDVDVESASTGSRVGLALKNIEPESMSRGMLLSDKPFEYKTEISGNINIHSSVKNRPENSYEAFVSDMMRYQRGRVENNKIILDKKIPVIKNNIVLSNNNIIPRVFATLNF